MSFGNAKYTLAAWQFSSNIRVVELSAFAGGIQTNIDQWLADNQGVTIHSIQVQNSYPQTGAIAPLYSITAGTGATPEAATSAAQAGVPANDYIQFVNTLHNGTDFTCVMMSYDPSGIVVTNESFTIQIFYSI